MKEKRFFYNGNLSLNSKITLVDEEFHHMSNVMRAKTGDKVCMFNGDGNFYFGEITEIAKKFAKISINKMEESENEPKVKIDVYQALAKGDKLSLVMQKITELGATSLILYESDFCDVKANSNKQDRMDAISIAASKQCGRATFVQSKGILKIKDIAELIKDYDEFFVAYENENGRTLVDELLEKKDSLNKVAIMIGAEGGFAEKEILLLKENGANIVSLGKRILRTETAAISCTAVISQILDK
ncbi:MAG: 16S rRNA (uracil(1498)-N(3))-methyltransferase [Clostridia bacterium]|nr:16S rRNA (uracil(1498)-N(3))-methyltransferase [Clostridia bacterium]